MQKNIQSNLYTMPVTLFWLPYLELELWSVTWYRDTCARVLILWILIYFLCCEFSLWVWTVKPSVFQPDYSWINPLKCRWPELSGEFQPGKGAGILLRLHDDQVHVEEESRSFLCAQPGVGWKRKWKASNVENVLATQQLSNMLLHVAVVPRVFSSQAKSHADMAHNKLKTFYLSFCQTNL